ncbi:MAG: DM13 domain-containing protein [Pseudomonadota bacterium]
MKHVLSVIMLAALTLFAVSGAWADVKGGFVGKSNHIITGSVTIEKNDDGSHSVTLSEDFSLDGAPDPRVGFGKDGNYVLATDLGELKSLTGGQTYHVPAAIDVAGFDALYIWCLQFSVPLGVAALN